MQPAVGLPWPLTESSLHCCRGGLQMAHGPIEVGFSVFSDFMSYHNGTCAFLLPAMEEDALQRLFVACSFIL